MALKAWIKDGKLVVDGSGHPILCETCPCGSLEFCSDCTIPDPLFGTPTVDGTAMSAVTMNLLSPSESFGFASCAANVGYNVTLVCDGTNWQWAVTLYYISPGATIIAWSGTVAPGDMTCSPFSLTATGNNTFYDGTTASPICGVHVGAVGTIPISLTIVE